MKTFKDLGFKIDDRDMPFITRAIRGVKTVKVEDMADTLTDRDPPATFTSDEIEWMKKTPISQVTVGVNYTDKSSHFFDLLVGNEPKLRLSGRSTTNGEFRGDIVRGVIERAKSTNNDSLTVYDAFQAHIEIVPNNAHFIYATTPAINNFLFPRRFGSKTPIFISLKDQLRDRVNSFGLSVFNSLDGLNACGLEDPDLTGNANQFLQSKLQETLSKVPILQELIDFLNHFNKFEEQLNIVNEKLSSFEDGSDAHIAATALSSKLSEARDGLLGGHSSIEKFKSSCEEACNVAERSALKEHRGWKQVFANIGFAVASIATLGIANIISKLKTGSFDFSKTNTDSTNKILKMKEELQDIPTAMYSP